MSEVDKHQTTQWHPKDWEEVREGVQGEGGEGSASNGAEMYKGMGCA